MGRQPSEGKPAVRAPIVGEERGATVQGCKEAGDQGSRSRQPWAKIGDGNLRLSQQWLSDLVWPRELAGGGRTVRQTRAHSNVLWLCSCCGYKGKGPASGSEIRQPGVARRTVGGLLESHSPLWASLSWTRLSSGS